MHHRELPITSLNRRCHLRLVQEMWGEEGAYRDLFAPILAFIEASLSAALQASARLLAYG